MPCTVTDFEFLNGYEIRFTFSDDTVRIIDFSSVLNGPVFAPLRNPALFRQAELNADTGTIEWLTGADFNPVILHDWPEYQKKIEHAILQPIPVAMIA